MDYAQGVVIGLGGIFLLLLLIYLFTPPSKGPGGW